MFEVVLHGPAGVHPVGVPVPVEVRVRNLGPGDALAAGVLDGSETGVRYPSYVPEVARNGTVVAGRPRADDPLVAPLRPEDFRLLTPGESMDPLGSGYLPLITFATFMPDRPGIYRFALTMSTESPDPQDWLGPLTRGAARLEMLGLVRQVPRFTVRADPLTVTVG